MPEIGQIESIQQLVTELDQINQKNNLGIFSLETFIKSKGDGKIDKNKFMNMGVEILATDRPIEAFRAIENFQ